MKQDDDPEWSRCKKRKTSSANQRCILHSSEVVTVGHFTCLATVSKISADEKLNALKKIRDRRQKEKVDSHHRMQNVCKDS